MLMEPNKKEHYSFAGLMERGQTMQMETPKAPEAETMEKRKPGRPKKVPHTDAPEVVSKPKAGKARKII
jgi:hypothetical protein